MKKLNYLVLFALIIGLASCNSVRMTMPPYTSVDKIIKVKAGMSIEEVNTTLGIAPYDIYNIQEDGSSILVYNYRIKDRRMDLPTDPTRQSQVIHGEERSQTEGTPWYGTEAMIYAFYQNGKLKSIISDKGRQDAEFIALINNNIQIIAQEKLVSLQAAENTTVQILDEKGVTKEVSVAKSGNSVTNKAVILPIRKDVEGKNQSSATSSVEPKKKSAFKSIVNGLAGVTVITLLIAILATV